MTKEKALYQTKLILECLPKKEYELIPKDVIDYIERNMQYDENIKIDSSIELERQDIDEKTFELLNEILKRIDINTQQKDEEKFFNNQSEEIMTLKNIIANLKKENKKIDEAKQLVIEYKKEIKQLNEKCNFLERNLNAIPNFIKAIFIRKNKYLLEKGK